MIEKSLYDISWKVDEPKYRADKALSYSTLAKYERLGFNDLNSLFDKVESPSLTFGSCVDSIITGGMDEFNDRFMVAEYPECSDTIIQIVKSLFREFHETHNSLNDIPNTEIIGFASRFNYQNNWKPETRARVIKEKGFEYYNLLYLSNNKTIISTKEYQNIINSVEALHNSKSTEWYFAPNNPFENIERLYQLKFKATFRGVDYRCMADLIVVDHDKKAIQPIDLKTSSHTEWDFYKSFIDWDYQIQARLYWRIIKDNIYKDSYFEDFDLLPYKFIVVNKNTLTPLVWDCPFTDEFGDLAFGKNNQIVLRDPFAIGEELKYYLEEEPKVPKGINLDKGNNLKYWLNTL